MVTVAVLNVACSVMVKKTVPMVRTRIVAVSRALTFNQPEFRFRLHLLPSVDGLVAIAEPQLVEKGESGLSGEVNSLSLGKHSEEEICMTICD